MRTIIKGGKIYDGSGKAPFCGDIIIDNDRITDICQNFPCTADKIIDASGMAVTPGFIDTHRHCDLAVMTEPHFGIIELSQGLTTVMGGNCGLAPLPALPTMKDEIFSYIEPCLGKAPKNFQYTTMDQYLSALENADHLPINYGSFVGIGSLKAAFCGYGRGEFLGKPMADAKAYIREAMEAGAAGLTTGIMYQPECYSTKKELTDLISATAPWGRTLAAHIRGEGNSLTDSVDEIISIAGNAGVPLNISHFKSTGINNWNKKIHEAIELIEKARASGQDVTVDFYPYCGGSTTLFSLIPPEVMADSIGETLSLLSKPAGRDKLKKEIYRPRSDWDNMVTSIGWDRIIISSVTLESSRRYINHSFAEAARTAGYDDPADFMVHLLVEERGKVGIILMSMSQNDVDTVAKLPYSMVISDSLYGISDSPHPRLYGSFPKIIREYVMERHILTLEEAIKKMSSMPAQRLGLKDRGLIRRGYKADICVFDPHNIRDNALYNNPKQLSSGFRAVMVNGTAAIENDIPCAENAGSVIRM